MLFAVAPAGRQDNFLMMTVAGAVRLGIYICQRFRVAEISDITYRQKKTDRFIFVPLGRHLKAGFEDKINIALSPVCIGHDNGPAAVI